MLTVDFSLLPLAPGWLALDAGCGDGRHLAALAERGLALCLGLDLNPGELASARKRLALNAALLGRTLSPVATLAASLTRLPLASQSLDLVVASEVLEHLPRHDLAVAELYRVLKPGGFLVVSVPRAWPERICWRLSPRYAGQAGGHVRIYRQSEIAGLLRGAGFRLWASGHAHALHSPFWWLKCLLGDEGDSRLVKAYHRFLLWDLMKKPPFTRFLEKLLNPLMGKSLVLYLRKDDHAESQS